MLFPLAVAVCCLCSSKGAGRAARWLELASRVVLVLVVDGEWPAVKDVDASGRRDQLVSFGENFAES